MVRTCGIRDLKNADGARWAIVRHAMRRHGEWRAAGIEWVAALAPSPALHRWWQDLREIQSPDYQARAWADYVRRFREEKVLNRNYWEAIRRATQMAQVGDLTLACWCASEEHCHRRLVVADIQKRLTAGQEAPSSAAHA